MASLEIVETPQIHQPVESDTSMFNRLEEMRMELEYKMGADKFLQIYTILEQYVGKNDGEWDYENCISRLRTLLNTEQLKEYIPLVHQFQYLEKSADLG